mmetsp:Transcript_64735/g.204599  ORF Transcript_64735/g.204599 Transcript_64735/m.204599 type:complete len:216 (-) Transcript_64735:450-1097(-)
MCSRSPIVLRAVHHPQRLLEGPSPGGAVEDQHLPLVLLTLVPPQPHELPHPLVGNYMLELPQIPERHHRQLVHCRWWSAEHGVISACVVGRQGYHGKAKARCDGNQAARQGLIYLVHRTRQGLGNDQDALRGLCHGQVRIQRSGGRVKFLVQEHLVQGPPQLVDRPLLHELRHPCSGHQLGSLGHRLRDSLADVEFALRALTARAAVHHGRQRTD